MTDPSQLPPPVGLPVGYEPEETDEPWAPWWRRVVATLIDIGLQLPFVAVSLIASEISQSGVRTQLDGSPAAIESWSNVLGGGLLGLAAFVASIVFSLWNTVFRQGRLGWSIGKQVMGIMVVTTDDGRPIGALLTFVRSIVHIVDYIPLGLGFLWPLWDDRKQTLADKIMGTCVLHLGSLRQ